MATATVFSATRSQAIEDAAIVDGSVVGDNLILERNDGTPIDAGNVRGPQGDTGDTGATGAPGLDAAFRVKAATTANITLSGTQTIDGVSCVAGDRVLVKDQSTASGNGIYVVAAGSWTRATDADAVAELGAATVNVQSGTANGGSRWVTTLKLTDTMGTTAMNWYRDVDGSNLAQFTTGGTTNATGFVTITHGLPWTPSQVLHSNGNPSASFAVLWGVESIGATQFSARFMNGSTGGALNTLSIGVARWTAFK
jgi:phage-related tail fiber protein